MGYIIKNLHFLVIHVPIAMLLFSFVFDGLAFVLKKKEWHIAGVLCLIVGTLGAVAAVITGPEDRNPLKPAHELYGEIAMVFFILLTSIRSFFLWIKKREIGGKLFYLAAAFIGVLLVSYTGHLGGEMVHPDRQHFQGEQRNGSNFQQRQSGTNEQLPNRQGERSPSDNGQQNPEENGRNVQ